MEFILFFQKGEIFMDKILSKYFKIYILLFHHTITKNIIDLAIKIVFISSCFNKYYKISLIFILSTLLLENGKDAYFFTRHKICSETKIIKGNI